LKIYNINSIDLHLFPLFPEKKRMKHGFYISRILSRKLNISFLNYYQIGILIIEFKYCNFKLYF